MVKEQRCSQRYAPQVYTHSGHWTQRFCIVLHLSALLTVYRSIRWHNQRLCRHTRTINSKALVVNIFLFCDSCDLLRMLHQGLEPVGVTIKELQLSVLPLNIHTVNISLLSMDKPVNQNKERTMAWTKSEQSCYWGLKLVHTSEKPRQCNPKWAVDRLLIVPKLTRPLEYSSVKPVLN